MYCIDDSKINWLKLKYKEKPVNNFRTTSWINYQNHTFIIYGTNEFSFHKQKQLKIILYRSVDYLGKPNLTNRPGVASGLINQKIITLDALYLNTKFNFEFDYFINSNHQEKKLNSIMNVTTHKPLIFNPNTINVYENKLNQFILAPTINFKINNFNYNFKIWNNKFIASSWLKDNNEIQLSIHDYDNLLPFEIIKKNFN